MPKAFATQKQYHQPYIHGYLQRLEMWKLKLAFCDATCFDCQLTLHGQHKATIVVNELFPQPEITRFVLSPILILIFYQSDQDWSSTHPRSKYSPKSLPNEDDQKAPPECHKIHISPMDYLLPIFESFQVFLVSSDSFVSCIKDCI
jgi:hypothetical protein